MVAIHVVDYPLLCGSVRGGRSHLDGGYGGLRGGGKRE